MNRNPISVVCLLPPLNNIMSIIHVRVSGCVIILGKTNMFRYNDPKEAASMRMNASINGGLHPQSAVGHRGGGAKLLSQSLSDLRLVAATTSSAVSSHEQLAVFSDSEESETIFNAAGATAAADAEAAVADTTNNNSKIAKSKTSVMSESSAKCSSVSDTSERSEEVVTPESSTSGATASSSGTGADSSSSIQDMTRLFDQINQQVRHRHQSHKAMQLCVGFFL